MMRFASLGSGSEGNALLVEAGATCVLMDCGFGLKDTVARLVRLGCDPERLNAILVTHEHGDHVRGVAMLARKYGIPVWMTHGTRRALGGEFLKAVEVREIDAHRPFSLHDIEVTPFPVPHDAAEPVQYVFGSATHRLGVLTDTGCSTPHIEQQLSGCDALVLECNHDVQMLRDGPYPERLKQRVGGRWGHLNNLDAAALLQRIDCSRVQHLVAAHLSLRNNRAELAVQALSAALGCEPEWVGIADQAEGFDWRELV